MQNKIKTKHFLFFFLSLVGLFAFCNSAKADACASAGTGNWRVDGTWTTCHEGSGSPWPQAGDTVTIGSGHVVTIQDSETDAADSITINNSGAATGITWGGSGSVLNVNAGAGTITLNAPANSGTSTLAVGAGTLTTSGTVTFNGGNAVDRLASLTISTGTVTIGGNLTTGGNAANTRLTFSGAGNLNIGGTFSYGGASTFTASTGTVKLTATSGTPSFAYYAFNNLEVAAGSNITYTSTGNFTVGGALTITSGTMSLGAHTLTVTGATSVTGKLMTTSATGAKVFNGGVTVNNGGIWDFSGGAAPTTFASASGITNNGTTFNNGTGTATFSASQSLSGSSAMTFGGLTTVNAACNLTNSVSGASVTIGGNLTQSGATAQFIAGDGSDSIFKGGVFTAGGNLIPAANAHTIEYRQNGAQAIKTPTTNNYWTLKIGGTSGAKTPGAGLTLNGDLHIEDAATFAGGTSLTHTFKGSWHVNTSAGTGAYTYTTAGTINFNAPDTPAATVIDGSAAAATAFNIVNFNNTSGFTVSQPISASGAATVAASVNLTNNSTATLSSTGSLIGTGTWTQGENGTLNLNFAGTPGITAIVSTATGNTVNYGYSAQTVRGQSYYNLSLGSSSAGATKTLNTGISNIWGNLYMSGYAAATTTEALEVHGNLNMDAGTLNLAGYDFKVDGTTSLNSSSATLTFASATGSKIFVGDVTNAGGWNHGGSVAASVEIQGNYTMSGSGGTSIAAGSTYTFSGTNKIINGSNRGVSFPNVVITGSVTYIGSAAFTILESLTGAGTYTNGDGVNGGLLAFAGTTIDVANFVASATGNTVSYNRSGVQTVRPVPYYNLILTTGSAKTMTDVTTINNDLTVSVMATMTGNSNFSVAGTWNYGSSQSSTLSSSSSISIGRFNQSGGTIVDNGSTITVTGTGASVWVKSAGTYTSTGTVVFTGAAPQIPAFSFNNLTINNGLGNAAVLTGALTLNGNLSIQSGGLNCNGQNQTYSGNISLSTNTTYTPGGTLTFTGNGSQTLTDNNATPQNLGTVVYRMGWQETRPAGDVGRSWYSLASSNDGTHLIAGSNQRIYTSTNGGSNWSETYPTGVGENKLWQTVASDADGSNLLTAVWSGRVYLSTNGGNSWSETFPTGSGTNKSWYSSASDADGSNLMVSGLNLSRLWITTTGGSSWSEARPAGDVGQNYNSLTMSADGTKMIAAVNGGRLWMSSDSGGSWGEIRPAGDVNGAWVSVACSSDCSRIIAAVSNGRVYISTNGGTSWSETYPTGAGINKNWVKVASSSDGHVLFTFIDSDYIYSSVDGGANWSISYPTGSTTQNWISLATSADGNVTLAGIANGTGNTRIYINNNAHPTANTPITMTSLALHPGVEFDITGQTLTFTGTGTPFNHGGNLITSGSTVAYTGSGSATNITNSAYNNLTLAPTSSTTYSLTGNQTAAAGTSIAGNLTIGADATLTTTGSNYNLDVAGNWSDSGAFTANTSTVTLNGSSNQNVTTGSSPFYNLTIENSSTSPGVSFVDASHIDNLLKDTTPSSTLTFTAGTTSLINDLQLNGGAEGTRIVVRSTSTNAANWNVAQASQTDVSYVSVSYNNANSGQPIDADNGTNSNAGHNNNWLFHPSNTLPALTSISASPTPIKGGSTISIVPSGQGDADSDRLAYYCNETGSPTSADTLCTEGDTDYTTPYNSMSCNYTVGGNATNTVYCRTYDWTGYSAERTTTYLVDSTAPTVTDDVPAAWQHTNISVTLSCNDGSGSGCSKVYYTTDGSAPTTLSPFVDASSSWKFTYSTEGTATLKYRGLDNTDNLEDTVTASNSLRLDTSAPTLTNVSASVSADSATITWSTNEAASSQVEYGLVSSYGSSTVESDISPRVATHSVSIPNLKSCARYYFRTKSTDAESSQGVSSQSDFTTTGCEVSNVIDGSEAEIDNTSGGSVLLPTEAGTATITAPINFYSEGADIQINQLDTTEAPTPPSDHELVDDNFYNLLAVAESGSTITSFDQPVSFVVTYGEEAERTYIESTLDVYKYVNGSWEKKSCVLDTGANTLTCSLNNFSTYGVFGQLISNSNGDSSYSPVIALGKKKIVNLSQNETVSIKSRKFFFRGKYSSLNEGDTVQILKNGVVIGTRKISKAKRWRYQTKQDINTTEEYQFRYLGKNSGEEIAISPQYNLLVDKIKPKIINFPRSIQSARNNNIVWTATDNDRIKYHQVTFRGKKYNSTEALFQIPQDARRGIARLTIKSFDRAGNSITKRAWVRIR